MLSAVAYCVVLSTVVAYCIITEQTKKVFRCNLSAHGVAHVFDTAHSQTRRSLHTEATVRCGAPTTDTNDEDLVRQLFTARSIQPVWGLAQDQYGYFTS